jgi:DNA-binding MarR family transcriptional regulator
MAQIVVLKRAHFFSIDNDIIDIHAKTIGATALAVYTVLSRYANRKTGECWPSIGRLAHLLDLARNTVKAALRTLEQAGLITIRRRRDPAGDATSHLYTLLDASPAAVATRLAQRRTVATPPEEGRSPDTLPLVTVCSTGGAPGDQEPSFPESTETNQDARAAGAGEDIPQAPTKQPCPHPIEERRQFGDMTLCTHCYQMITVHAEVTREDTPPEQEALGDASAA